MTRVGLKLADWLKSEAVSFSGVLGGAFRLGDAGPVVAPKNDHVHRLLKDGWGSKRPPKSLGTILIIILILMPIGVLPSWPHRREWGYAPSGVVGTVVLILVVLFLRGRLYECARAGNPSVRPARGRSADRRRFG
jgi:hypothetical protein